MYKVAPRLDLLTDEQQEEIELLDECEQHRVMYLVNVEGLPFDDAMYEYKNVDFYQNMDEDELVKEFVNAGVILCDVPEYARQFLDYDNVFQYYFAGDGWHFDAAGAFRYA